MVVEALESELTEEIQEEKIREESSVLRPAIELNLPKLEIFLVSRCSSFFQLLAEFITVYTLMYPSMAVRTKRNDILWIVWTAITPPCKVMDLEEWVPILTQERSLLFAALANTVSDSKREFADDVRARIRTTAARATY